ncbi:alpha-galactosidase [Bacteroidota bacterium]
MNKILLGICAILTGLISGCDKQNVYHKTLELSNEVVSKKFGFATRRPGTIYVELYNAQNELIAKTTKKIPYFEFILNNELTTSNDRIWLYKTHSTRQMGNEGLEYKIVFQGADKHVNGLEIIILQQIFPNSTLIREKLILRSPANQTFELNKNNDKPHFLFPQYTIISEGTGEAKATEIRLASWELKPITYSKDKSGNEGPKYNHMFYPNILTQELIKNKSYNIKGPINIINIGKYSWITAYEHASQDNLKGIIRRTNRNQEPDKLHDPLQSTKGVFNFLKNDDDFKFIGIEYSNKGKKTDVSVTLLRGAYLEGEEIDSNHPYSTIWSASAFYEGDDIEKGKSIIRHYLFKQICKKPASRKPEFYYNTWNMQGEVSRRNKINRIPIRDVLTYKRIFKEIDYAAELGVDIFVLDCGWEQMQGVWRPHSERLPQGLAPIKQKLDEYGIKMGLWFSPPGIDSTAERFKEHPEWVIKDSNGEPVKGQWGLPVFDLVSDFMDVFINDCKKIVDEGALFFKWDAINTFYSSLPNLHHGSDKYSEKEIRERYGYLLPIYITSAMEVLTEYKPELVIEIDLTEARRVMMGLAPLSQGKIFFMNHGAASPYDYSSFRAKAMRTIPNEYAGIIPLELFTYAHHPQNIEGSMDYNVNSSLIAGHGFWGNLELTSQQERLAVRKKVNKSKRVLPYITEINTLVQGEVGDSPEVYTQVNSEESAGQVIVFTNEPVSFAKKIRIDQKKLLGVLNHQFELVGDSIFLDFHLNETESTKEVFIIPNSEAEISITSSTCSLDEVNAKEGFLEYHTNGSGKQEIYWSNRYGDPEISGLSVVDYFIEQFEEFKKIFIEVDSKTRIIIKARDIL